MKKFAIGVLVVLMAMAGTVSAQDLTKVFSAGVFFDYGIGFGDAFDDYSYEEEDFSVSAESKLSYSFGALVRYNFAPAMGVLGMADYQVWKYDYSYSYDIEGFSGGESDSENEHFLALCADFAYYLMPGEKTQPYLAIGPGVYMFSGDDSETKFGFNGVFGVIHFVGEKIAIDARAQFHMIPSAYTTINEDGEEEDKAITAAQIHLGVSYFFFPASR